MADSRPNRGKNFPVWLKKRLRASDQVQEITGLLEDLGLATVCAGAHCPNLPECYGKRTATFMILGRRCTRNCRFCAVPPSPEGPPDPQEPENVAEACERLALRHAVITSVTRDDLPDQGAAHFAATIRAVRKRMPETVIEVLTPDFQRDTAALDTVIAAQPRIFNHNVETVPRLYPDVRPEADYQRSLDVLRYVAEQAKTRRLDIHTKSGLMVGMGEKVEEVDDLLRDLRAADCEIVTIGQYLAPTDAHFPVVEYVEPAVYEHWKELGKEIGFRAVAAGPYVRSSYQAEEVFKGEA